ncbi:MAG: cation:proton antiporter [Acidimicrobiales bacterium]
MTALGGLLIVLGAGFVLIGAVGVLRFTAPIERLHAGAKGPTLGLMLVGAGTALSIGSTAATAGVALVLLLQLLAGPVGAHMIGRVIQRDHDTPPSPRGVEGQAPDPEATP